MLALATSLLAMLCADPFADQVVDFAPGVGGSPGYDQPATALGPPERLTGEAAGQPMVVSPFAPAWSPDELVSLGAGGFIVLGFDEPVIDDPANLYGVDLLLFGNAGLIDGAYPAGICAGLFGGDGGVVEVSADGTTWIQVDPLADALWPTMAWRDTGPYAVDPGDLPSDVVRPMAPTHTVDDIMGQGWDAIVPLYDGSAGGTGVDLAPTGLAAISFVRISVSDDAFLTPEIDAVVDVGRWGDATGDHLVNVDDILAVVGAFGHTGLHLADRTADGVVDVGDLLLVLECWP
ncbi:MAG: hypothetical protein MK074_01355 [Phycisphaerales bacterium]|nr:hypothetical protein [Phycisphaerales bacterium]